MCVKYSEVGRPMRKCTWLLLLLFPRGCHSFQRWCGPCWLHSRMPKCVLFCFVTSATWTFGHSSCADFDRSETKDVNQCAHADTSRKFPNSCGVDFTGLQTAKMGTFEGMFVIRLQLKWHNLGQWKSS